MRLSFSERKAPAGKFRIVGSDTFSKEDWIVADLDSPEECIEIMKIRTKGKSMLKMYCYDETGTVRASAGTF